MRLSVLEVANLLGDRISYRELMAGGPPWLDHRLVVTERARARLSSWLAGGGLERSRQETSEARRVRIAENLLFYGDGDEMRDVVVAAWLRTPPCVSDVLLGEVAVFGYGWRFRGLTISSKVPRETLILLDAGGFEASQLVRLTLHENAHAWLHRPMAGDAFADLPAIPTFTHRALREVGAREGWLGDVERRHTKQEQEADALAEFWLSLEAERY